MKYRNFIILTLLLLSSEVWAQARKPASIEELATYLGADREQILYAGAKAEGKVVWYTSLAGGSYKEIVKVVRRKVSRRQGRSLSGLRERFDRSARGGS